MLNSAHERHLIFRTPSGIWLASRDVIIYSNCNEFPTWIDVSRLSMTQEWAQNYLGALQAGTPLPSNATPGKIGNNSVTLWRLCRARRVHCRACPDGVSTAVASWARPLTDFGDTSGNHKENGLVLCAAELTELYLDYVCIPDRLLITDTRRIPPFKRFQLELLRVLRVHVHLKTLLYLLQNWQGVETETEMGLSSRKRLLGQGWNKSRP